MSEQVQVQENTEKRQLTDYEQFAKLNDKYVKFTKPTSKYLNGRIAIMATVKLFNEDGAKTKPELEKALQELADSYIGKADKEIEDAKNYIQNWLTDLIKAIYNYKNASDQLNEEKLKVIREKVMKFINETGAGLNPELIFCLITIFFL